MRITIGPFLGMRPAEEPHLLGQNEAQVALDTRMETGAVEGLPASTNLLSLTVGGARGLWRYPAALETNYWFNFANYANVARSPTIDDVHDRIYWTDGIGPKYAPASLAISGAAYPGGFYKLGIPVPTSTISAAGTTGTAESRTYAESFLSAYDEEGAPGPLSPVIDIDPTQAVTLSNLSPAPTGNYNIDRRMIWRSVLVNGSQGSLQLVDTIPIADTTYVDTKESTGRENTASTFLPPPDSGFGLRVTEGGVGILLNGRQVHMSEPDLLHAWNPDYIQSLQVDPVAVSCFGQMVVILTKGEPYVGMGIEPAAIQLSRISDSQACLSAAGVTESKFGCLYPSPEGLIAIGSDGIPQNVTAQFMTQRQWLAYNPSSFIAVMQRAQYHAYFTRTDGSTGELVIDPTGQTAPITERSQIAGQAVTAAFRDPFTDYAYVARNGQIQRVEKDGAPQTYRWRSRNFRASQDMLLDGFIVFGDAGTVTFRAFAKGVLKFEKTLPTNKASRMGRIGRQNDWAFEIESSVKVTEIRVAPSIQELFE